MKTVLSYTVIEAACPDCGDINSVDHVLDDGGKHESQCEACEKPFNYVHPDNSYGVAVEGE